MDTQINFRTNVFDLKTSQDVLFYLCAIESELYTARAYSRLGLCQEREEPRELTDLENTVTSAGEAFGFFLYFLHRGVLPKLSETGREVLSNLRSLGHEVHAQAWEWSLSNGKINGESEAAYVFERLANNSTLDHVKTSYDILCYLSLLESELMGAGMPFLFDSKSEVDTAVYNTGFKFGYFLFALQRNKLPALPESGRDVMNVLDKIGKDVNASVWERAVNEGKRDRESDEVIAALDTAY